MNTGNATGQTWRARLKRGARALVSSIGTQAHVADLLGRSPQLVSLWCHDDFAKVVAWEHVVDERIPAAARAAFFAEVAGEGVLVVALERWASEAGRESDLRLAATGVRASSDSAAALLDSIADGVITRAEGAKLLAAVDHAIGVLLAIRGRAQAAVREGVVGENVVALRATGSRT
jgi:hypothetical protein